MSAAVRKQLRQLLADSPSMLEFLGDVVTVLELAHADDACPDGFELLERAVEAFEDADDDGDEGEDEGDDDEEDDEEEDDEP